MKKAILKGLAVASVVAIGSGVNVKADEVESKEEPKETVSVGEVKTVTEADVKTSEDKLIEATNAVNEQKEVVVKGKADKQNAETTLSTAKVGVDKAEALVKEATPEAIEGIKADIAKTETALPESDKVIDMAEREVNEAETAVSDQETVVNTVKADLSVKETAVSEAQADVDKAQAILDGTNQASLVAEAEEADKALEKAQTNLATAEAELIKAKAADQKRDQAIAAWAGKVATAQADLEAKEVVLTTATAKADETGTALAQAQDTLSYAENKVNAINTIKFTPEYIEAFKNYIDNYFEKGVEAKKILDSLAKEHRSMNRFRPNLTDESVILDTNNMTDDVLLELSNFASDLINQIRITFGKPTTVVTPSAIKFASLVADGYVNDNWSWKDLNDKGHDEKAISSASAQLGLRSDKQYYENLYSYSSPYKNMTLSKAKEHIYTSVIQIMFNGWEYLHAKSISGDYNDGTTYLGVDFSVRKDATSFHFLLVDDSHILDASKFDKTPLANPYDSEAIRQAYETAQTAYSVAKGADDKAKSEKALAQESYNTANTVLSEAKQSLAEVEAQAVLTPNAQAKRDEAKVLEVTAKERHVKAQEALANLSADVKVKQANLVKAKEVLEVKTADKTKVAELLATEQAKLRSLKTVVNDKNGILSKAKSSKTDLQEKLASQTTHLERLNNAPKVLETARSEVAKAQEQLANAVAKLEKEVNTLKELEAKQAEVKEQHAKIVEAYQTVLEVKRQAELERQKEEIEKRGELALPVFDEKGHLSAYVSEHKEDKQETIVTSQTVLTRETKSLTSNSSQVAIVKGKSSKTLPKTNSQSSVWLTLMGLLAILTGLFVSKRQRN